MKIYNNNGQPIKPVYHNPAESNSPKEEPLRVGPPSADSLAISKEAVAVREAMKEAMLPEDIRAEKVAQLREAITNGTFVTDSRKICEGMLSKE